MEFIIILILLVHDIDDIALVNYAIEKVLQLGFCKLLFRHLVTDKLADIGIGIKAAAGNRFRSRIKSRTLVFALINRFNRFSGLNVCFGCTTSGKQQRG